MNIRFAQPRVARLAALVLLCIALTYACGGGGADTTQPPPAPPTTPTPAVDRTTLGIISGAGQTDTIHAVLPQPLVVEIRDSIGAPVSSRTVIFTTIGVSVGPVGQQIFGISMSTVTDSTGRAQCRVKLGGTAGLEALTVGIGGSVVTGTVFFTATHGAPALFTLSPRDTAVPPGGSYTLKVVEITDRGGNPLLGLVPTFSATGASVSADGLVTVPNTSPLRAKVVVSYQNASDTAKVSVYPRIPMVIARQDMGDASGNLPGSSVVRINSDGTGSTLLTRTTDVSISPSSVAATPSVVYYRGDPSVNSKLWVVQPNGAPRLLLPGQSRTEAWPRLSFDGNWVYFARDMKSLWRVRIDGTGLDSLTSFATNRSYQAPAISPDGRSVAIEDSSGLQIVDVTTKAKRTLPITCTSPSYSPDGTSIACASPVDVFVMRTDGSGRRVVATFGEFGGQDGYSGTDWSPDGKWLLVTLPSYPELVEVATGTEIPLQALSNRAFQTLFVR
jgi:hypothetical protein